MCPICYSYPLIKVLKDQPDKIEVNCKCGFEQKIQIKEYFHQMKHIQKKNPKCERNQSHSEKIASEFCHNVIYGYVKIAKINIEIIQKIIIQV